MHEYPITEQIIKISVESAIKNGGKKISRITLVIGELAGFVGDSIQMYFDIIAEGTLAEGAKLEIINIKAELKCINCHKQFTRKRFSFDCPFCGSSGEPTEIGKEFYVKDIEIAFD